MTYICPPHHSVVQKTELAFAGILTHTANQWERVNIHFVKIQVLAVVGSGKCGSLK